MKTLIAALALSTALIAPGLAAAKPVTLTVTMADYGGRGAYLAVYVTDASGAYVGSLWMAGGKSKYYKHLTDWARFTGGNLAEVLDKIAWLVRERLRLRGEVRTLSAEGRLSAVILTALPFAVAGVVQLVNPGFLAVLWSDPAGTQIVGFALAGIVAHHFAKLDEVRHAAGLFELHVDRIARAGDQHALAGSPEFLADFGDALNRAIEACARAGHAALVPHDLAELAVERIDRALALDRKHAADALAGFGFGLFELRQVGVHRAGLLADEVVGDGRGNHEVAIGKALHERRSAEAVGTVIGKICFAQHMQAGDVRHQIVIHPQPAHRVVDGRINHHRQCVWIFAGDLFVHLEKVAVTRADRRLAEALDRIAEIKVNAEAGR
jgi:hypothetical protein